MKFCNLCGSPVVLRLPDDDNRNRFVCTACDEIHYENPKLIVGSLPVWQDKVLLCKRAIEPRLGLWTLPAGFMENGETTSEAASRETLEEANARINIIGLYTMYNLAHINQVHLLFRAELLDLDFSPGIESLEVRLFEEKDIPWDLLAFRPIKLTLQNYFADRSSDNFPFRISDLVPLKDPAT